MISIIPEHAPPSKSLDESRGDEYQLIIDNLVVFTGDKLKFIQNMHDMSTEIASQLLLFDWFFDKSGAAMECLNSVYVYKNGEMDENMSVHVRSIIKQKISEI